MNSLSGDTRLVCTHLLHLHLHMATTDWLISRLKWVLNSACKSFSVSTVKSPILSSNYRSESYHVFSEMSPHHLAFNRWPCPFFHKGNGDHKEEESHCPCQQPLKPSSICTPTFSAFTKQVSLCIEDFPFPFFHVLRNLALSKLPVFSLLLLSMFQVHSIYKLCFKKS